MIYQHRKLRLHFTASIALRDLAVKCPEVELYSWLLGTDEQLMMSSTQLVADIKRRTPEQSHTFRYSTYTYCLRCKCRYLNHGAVTENFLTRCIGCVKVAASDIASTRMKHHILFCLIHNLTRSCTTEEWLYFNDLVAKLWETKHGQQV